MAIKKEEPAPEATEAQVLDFLRRNPDFLKKNPELLAVLTPPARVLGDGVADFQHFQLKNLQKNTESLKGRYDVLVDFCRDNLSVQGQVHDAVLRLICAHTLEQLLEVITLDLVSLFDVDVVRLAMESEGAELYDTFYGEHNYSGIVFVPPGTSQGLLAGKKALLVEDATLNPSVGFDEIFADCAGLIQSFALLKLEMERTPRTVMLAFGVRYKDRFHPGQGLDLLTFLARIVAHQLDRYLSEMGV